MTDQPRTDRVTDVDGRLVSREDLTADEAHALTARLTAEGKGWRWERDTGPRAGWCIVAGFFPTRTTGEATA